jgi:hypothetical protein
VRSWVAPGGGGSFIGLSDVPATYGAGDGGKFVKVNAAHNGLEFVSGSSGGASAFIDLSDAPSAYVAGDALKIVRVNAAYNGIEFGPKITISAAAPSGGNDGDIHIQYDASVPYSVNADCTDPATVIALCNQLRAALVGCNICV